MTDEKLFDPEEAFPESNDEQFERLLKDAPDELANYARAIRMMVKDIAPFRPPSPMPLQLICPAKLVYKVRAFRLNNRLLSDGLAQEMRSSA